MNGIDVRTKCSIRGRVAFALAVAEQCLPALHCDKKIYELSSTALKLAWRWAEGENIHGDVLDYYLENSDDESLAVYGCDPPESGRAALMALTSAIAYVTWHAYLKEGVRTMSSTIHDVDESVLDEVVEFAKENPGFDTGFLDCISAVLVKECHDEDPRKLGRPINRRKLVRECDRR
jgi:hypothetical protein